jgi:hypothetical protein
MKEDLPGSTIMENVSMCNNVTPDSADYPSRIRPIPQSSEFWALLRAYYDVRKNKFPPGTYPPWYQDDEAFIRAFMKNHAAGTGISSDDFYAEFMKNRAVGIRSGTDTDNGGALSVTRLATMGDDDDETGIMTIDMNPAYDQDSVDGEGTGVNTECKKRKCHGMRKFQFLRFRGGCALSL